MNSVQTLFRRTAAALGAIAALTAPGLATAQTVSLTGASGNSCTYSQMIVLPNGNVAVICNNVASPGVFTLTAPSSISTGSQTTASQIRVNRASGSSGPVDIGFGVSGTSACSSATPTPIAFADGDLAAKPILIDTVATAGTCIITLLQPSAGSLGNPSAKTMSVVDPESDVTFSFAATSSPASIGGSNVQIVVNRSGGSNNAWTVPVTLSGGLTASNSLISGTGTTSPAGSPAGSPLLLVFPAGSASATVTFSPAGVTPAAPALPSSLVLTLGQPTKTAATAQLGTSVAPLAHTLTLNGPAVGCPVPETVANSMLGAFANGTTLRMASEGISTFVLPAPTLGKSTATFKLAAGTSTFPVDPYYFEVHINKCKGLVQATPGDTCYGKFSTNSGIWPKIWFTKTISGNTAYDTAAKIQARGYCYAPTSEGPWYVNIRYVYAGCTIAGNCGWNYQWMNWNY